MNSFHDSESDPDLESDAFLEELLDKGRWVYSHDWNTDHFGNSSGSLGVLELDGRYFVVRLDDNSREVSGEFNSLMDALKSPEGQGLGWLGHGTSSIECDALTVEQLWEVCEYDPVSHGSEESCAGETLTLNDVLLAWDWDYSLTRPSAVAPHSPSEAEVAISEDEPAGVEVVDPGPPRIFTWKEWFWLESSE